MKSRTTTELYNFKVWDQAYLGICGPSGTPHREEIVVQTKSDDLEVSFGNRERSRNLPKLDIQLNVIEGSPFRVVKRDHTAWSTLGPGEHLIERFSGGPCHDAMLAPQFARFASFSNSTFPETNASSFTTLEELGRLAISRCAPNKSNFSMSEFLGELRDGFPNAVGLAHDSKGRLLRAKQAGSEYLNVEFGWKPLYSDIQDFVSSVENANAILDRYYRNAGKLVKTSYSFPDKQTYEVIDSGNGYFPVPNNADSWMYDNGGRLGIIKEMKQKRWFEGGFTYVLPDRESFRGKYASMNKLFGTNITPETAWELTPWSWAADWVVDSGTLAKNLALFQTDGLMLQNAFMMEETVNSTTYQLMGVKYDGNRTGRYGEHNFFQTFTTTVKQRVPASPFGFGLTFDGFTQRQLALLAAAGIQRA